MIINDRTQDRRIAAWIAEEVEVGYNPQCICFGVEHNGELIGAAMFNDYNGANICLHQRMKKPNAMTRELLRTVFDYAFNVLKVVRVTGATHTSNVKAIDLNTRLGFLIEGVTTRYYPDGDGIIMMVMWPEYCRWIK